MPPARFVTDSSLEFTARRLRILGYDVAGMRGARLEELFETAVRESRAVLSLSDRHPRRYGAITLIRLPRGDAALAVRRIATEHEATSPPFARCPSCNVALQRRHPMEARGEVPGRVLRAVREFSYCPQCGKWYWAGSHVVRLRAWFEAVLGRALPPAAGDAGGA